MYGEYFLVRSPLQFYDFYSLHFYEYFGPGETVQYTFI